MRIFISETLPQCQVIELLSGKISTIESPIKPNLIDITSSIKQADAVLVPHDAFFLSKHPDYSDYLKFLNEISQFKLIILSDRGDFPIRPNLKNSVSLRVALAPSESTKQKVLVPYNILTLKDLEYRKYSRYPDISFMGFVPNPLSPQRFVKSFTHSPKHPLIGNGSLTRNISVYKCKKNFPNFNCTIKKDYFLSNSDRKNRGITRKLYLENINSSDIVLSPRGDSNQSQRYYEILSCGRIALIPNTKISYPASLLESNILARQAIIFNLFSKNLESQVQEFWENIGGNRNYFKLQKEIRSFFAKNLDFSIFIKKLLGTDLDTFKATSNY